MTVQAGEVMHGEQKHFDIAILGGGPGGYPAAIRAAQLGKSVALIEHQELGGTCLNRGCIPSKTLIAGGEFLAHLKQATSFGIEIDTVAFHYAKLEQHKETTVKKMRKGLEELIASNQIALFRGFGKFSAPRTLKILGKDASSISADKIILATGSEPKNFPAFPCDGIRIHDSTSLLNLTKLPSSIAIIGGGVIGVEFASLYNQLGVKVTLLELQPRIIPMEAQELSSLLANAFVKRGIQVETGVKIEKISQTEKGVAAHIEGGRFFEAECCLIAIGRTLNTKNIGLEHAGINTLENGMIPVNEKMETIADGIYAVGDIASKWWLAHVASHQGIIAAENAAGKTARMDYTAIPNVIFTHPEIGSVGLTLQEAIKKGYRAKASAFPFTALGKSQALLQTEGFAQIIIEEKTGQILGAQVAGYQASTLIAEMTIAIANELTVACIAQTMHAHPTLSEAWSETAFLAEGLPLHLPKRA